LVDCRRSTRDCARPWRSCRTTPTPVLSRRRDIRIGIADKRSYEGWRVAVVPPAAGAPFWQPIDVDLSAYAGGSGAFLSSGRPPWRFNADAIPGLGTVAWKTDHHGHAVGITRQD
jgi:hypothetical protein